MFEVPESFRAMPRWWGSDTAWLDGLPAAVAVQVDRWDATFDGQVWHGSNALVVAVTRGGVRLAARFVAPGDDLAAEAEALRFWDGRGTVRLVDADLDARVMLLERLDGSRSLADVPVDRAVDELGRALRRQLVPAPTQGPTTGAAATATARTLDHRWAALEQPFPAAWLPRLRAAAARRMRPSVELAVNADLHHRQVLAATRERWLVVDPVLVCGDPEFALGPMLWNRLDEVPDSRLERHVADLVQAAGLDPDRARDWIALRAADYLLWGLDHGLTEDPVRCRRLLTRVLR